MRRAFGEYGITLVVVIIAVAVLGFIFGTSKNGFFGSENLGKTRPVQTTESKNNYNLIDEMYDRPDPVLTVELPKLHLEESYNLLDPSYIKEAKDADNNSLDVTVEAVLDPSGENITPEEKDGKVILSLSNDNKKREDYFTAGVYKITYKTVETAGVLSTKKTVSCVVDAAEEDIYDVLFLNEDGESITEYPVRLRSMDDTHLFPGATKGYTFYHVTQEENGAYIKEHTYPWTAKWMRGQETVMLFPDAGAFDADGNMVNTWDELIEKGSIVVEDNILTNCTTTDHKVVFDNGIIEISKNACMNTRSKEIVIPSSVTTISDNAFCDTLASDFDIYIPTSVTAIGKYVFSTNGNVTIHYAGTEKEWDEIEKETGWNSNVTITMEYTSSF